MAETTPERIAHLKNIRSLFQLLLLEPIAPAIRAEVMRGLLEVEADLKELED
jgi:hypothetical protein